MQNIPVYNWYIVTNYREKKWVDPTYSPIAATLAARPGNTMRPAPNNYRLLKNVSNQANIDPTSHIKEAEEKYSNYQIDESVQFIEMKIPVVESNETLLGFSIDELKKDDSKPADEAGELPAPVAATTSPTKSNNPNIKIGSPTKGGSPIRVLSPARSPNRSASPVREATSPSKAVPPSDPAPN
ncbi:hypothetical protein HDV01_005470 [Terramyces sp. JEL0728]|nr:hypothetical protein HDV01_005470 [Terramyces sp. JEL0728]